ncbi:hypothetical protein JTE90_003166 [Oedothorax gibbosus]|uniref:Uncharacterized protein n=1 Tax=Oedothorax gibbosus TaxID=931172 RepID=A0AAV6U7K8_9ARAC|nr:hypothetical protein JTE90_003166 [Oedothorax gibbosus]
MKQTLNPNKGTPILCSLKHVKEKKKGNCAVRGGDFLCGWPRTDLSVPFPLDLQAIFSSFRPDDIYHGSNGSGGVYGSSVGTADSGHSVSGSAIPDVDHSGSRSKGGVAGNGPGGSGGGIGGGGNGPARGTARSPF